MSLYKYTAIAKEYNSKPKWTSLRHLYFNEVLLL